MDPVDLTRRLEPGMPVYPGDPGVSATTTATMESDGYRVTELSFTTHAGTHIDAPAHMEPDGATLDAFDVGAFRFDARLVDLAGDGDGLAAREPITPALLPDDLDRGAERAGGEPEGADGGIRGGAGGGPDMVVIRTGWGDHWGDERYFDHPYLTAAAARAIAEAGCAVGLDTINPDPTPTANARGDGEARGAPDHAPDGRAAARDEPDGVPAHRELLGRGSFIVENLALPDGLPGRFTLRAYPLRVDADGAPVRAVAE